MSDDLSTFGKRLIYVRRQRTYSQAYLSVLVGFDISPFEDESALPSSLEVLRISNTLQCSLNWLMEGYKVISGQLLVREIEVTDWPCGCKAWTRKEQFFIQPCSQECPVFSAAIEESHQRGNRVETRGTT